MQRRALKIHSPFFRGNSQPLEDSKTHLDVGVAAAVEDLPRLHSRDRDRDRHLLKT